MVRRRPWLATKALTAVAATIEPIRYRANAQLMSRRPPMSPTAAGMVVAVSIEFAACSQMARQSTRSRGRCSRVSTSRQPTSWRAGPSGRIRGTRFSMMDFGGGDRGSICLGELRPGRRCRAIGNALAEAFRNPRARIDFTGTETPNHAAVRPGPPPCRAAYLSACAKPRARPCRWSWPGAGDRFRANSRHGKPGGKHPCFAI